MLWLRLPLPFRLDHVNVHLIEDGDGWAVLDTGIGDARTQEIWEAVLAGPLRGAAADAADRHAISIPTMSGWPGGWRGSFGLELWMPRPEYLFSLALQYAPADLGAESWRPFYRRHGLDEIVTDRVLGRGHLYLRSTTGVPSTYHRIQHGDVLEIGGRRFQVLTGGGHSLEAGDAVLRGGKAVLRRRPGDRQDLAQRQRDGDGAGGQCARHLPALAGGAAAGHSGRGAGAVRARAAVRGAARGGSTS